MPPLSSELRRTLENSVIKAREEAERAAAAAIAALAVERNEAFPAMSNEQRGLRNALRARVRQLGGGNQVDGMPLLVEEVAYVQWHRMLFARFLAENDLLMHPAGVPTTLEECAELAPEEGEADAWQLAARYAGLMLPGIFRTGDPTAQIRFAPEGRSTLERIIVDLPAQVFIADDALGWVYQFWQTRRKDAVNKSGRKIGGPDIAPVTQLFTEHYMVQFLLENSLGAWWAARHPNSPLVKTFTYLRFRDDGRPAAGTFPGWPAHAAEVTMIDPCCGSGHFLVAAFEMLRRMRMEEEGLDERAAAEATIRDNIYGLELDPRCTQIAAFALAFAAWKAAGYRPLPALNIACSGIPVQGQLADWLALAGEDRRLSFALEQIYQLFKNAPDLGSLINPADLPLRDRMFSADYNEVEPLLTQALSRERHDPAADVFGAAAEGVAKAARLLAGKYTLVATNVPYLGYKKQADVLKRFCEKYYSGVKMDLATVFISRSRELIEKGQTCAIVSPQNWLFLGSYEDMRKKILQNEEIQSIIWLGAGAFDTIGGEVVQPILLISSNNKPSHNSTFFSIDTSAEDSGSTKAIRLIVSSIVQTEQAAQLKNPDGRIALGASSKETLLERYAAAPRGVVTGDSEYWVRRFWEIPEIKDGWRYLQGPSFRTEVYGGREHIINWKTNGSGMLRPGLGNVAYGRVGVAVNRMSQLACTLYAGELYDQSAAIICPFEPKHVPAIWAFCRSQEFYATVRQLDKKVGVTPATLVKVPFDLERWQKVAEEMGPLPEPHSDDPTQWLFNGRPAGSEAPLQVAVARLLGYRWPQQEYDGLDLLADEDGIVCLPPVARELPADERLRDLLTKAYGTAWGGETQARLLADVGAKDLGTWLRDDFFKQHCALFHNRPFIWQIWDGRKDGFSALVNYHKLDGTRLDKLIYTYLGSWIEAQRAGVKRGESGADGRLVAALELQEKLIAIRTGEPPYDIYVRWKALREQPIGWNPDLNDGVRLNIRPFVMAGVLRAKFTINWNKDRGTNPDGSERLNDRHYTNAEKQAARGG